MPKRKHFCQTVVVLLLFVVGPGVMAGEGRRSPESDLAAPGAPLYEYAVTESVNSLMSKEEQAEHRPPSPGPDYFWCENCKTYHKRQAPASGQQPAAAQVPGAAPASPRQPGTATAARPLSPGPDYYWCEQCKSYHLRPTSAQQPGASPATPHAQQASPAVGTAVAGAPGGDYYYCEKCKTYHRRQPVVQPVAAQPAELSLILGGVSNSANRNPLTIPGNAEH